MDPKQQQQQQYYQQPPPQQSYQVQQYPQQPQQQQYHQPQPQQAYQPQQQMQVQYHQGSNVGNQEWQNSLMDCSPCENCLLGTFLPCILLGRTSERMRDPTMQTYDTFNTDCLLMCGISYLTGCGWIYAMMKRSEIRERYGIKGDGMSDCCAAYWCGCCALIQHEKEVVLRTAQGPIAQGYQPQKQGMHMPTQ